MKVIVVAAYVGKLPENFGLWLKSAEANPQLDFLVVGDADPPALPENVRFKQTTLEALREHWSALTGIDVALFHPYKLNDFKPMYWSLVEDLDRYDYWGFCDLDVIFGNFQQILPETLGRFDMILSEGHMRFLRNDEHTRQAWRVIRAPRRWQDILANPVTFGMDEHHGINRVFAGADRSWFSDPGMVADIDPGFRQLRRLPVFRNFRCQAFFWQDGRLFREYWHQGRYGRDEFLYAHLQKRKMPVDPACLSAQAFDIGPQGFVVRSDADTSASRVAGRNRWHFPNAAEARILLREMRRRLLRRPTTFAAVNSPTPANAGQPVLD